MKEEGAHMNTKEQQLIKKWMKRRKKALLEKALFITCMDILMIYVLFLRIDFFYNESLPNKLFGYVCIAVFIALAILQWKRLLNGNRWEIQKASYGVVMEKRRHTGNSTSQGKNARGYYVIVKELEKMIEAKCDAAMYEKIHTNDTVLLVRMKPYQVYALHVE